MRTPCSAPVASRRRIGHRAVSQRLDRRRCNEIAARAGTLGGMPFPATRLRRLRATPVLRDLVRETRLTPADLVLPLFVESGRAPGARPIASLPGVDRLSISAAVEEAGEAAALGMPAVLLFGIPEHKDAEGTRRLRRRGHRPARHARDQGRPPRPRSSSPTSASASTPTTATAACCAPTAPSTTTRASSSSRAPRSPTRAPAPTSSRRAT